MRLASFMVLLAALVGCAGIDHGVEWKDGNFEVAWTDLTSNTSLAFREGGSSYTVIVEPCISAVGSNEDVVVVEQVAPSTGTSTFYVLHKSLYGSPAKAPKGSVVGPLSASAYASLQANRVMPALQEVLPRAVCRGAA